VPSKRSECPFAAEHRALESAGVRFVAISQGLDVRPGSDAMSHLILGVLASVAEFEREIIRERTRLGLGKARRAGKRLGRPPRILSPAKAEQVRRLRSQGRSWAQVAEEVRCSVWAARQAG
jgi:DNA invertase Pin-like site-specific DNA recombinase